jgi:hypothetical protein
MCRAVPAEGAYGRGARILSVGIASTGRLTALCNAVASQAVAAA